MCICGKNENFNGCCGGIISGQHKAKTPEQLMRSRFSAYARADGRYLILSAVRENQYEDDAALIQEFSNSVEWLKLDVLTTEGDTVEFKAYYRDESIIHVLHEKSNFVMQDGQWKYKDGELYKSKVERNESCPCGSGKKFKKCCD